MFIEIQIPLLFPVCSQFLKICNLEQMASVGKTDVYLQKHFSATLKLYFKKGCHLPFWFLIVIHGTSSIELYQLCVIWWQPMSGLTKAWQQISGSFMTITACQCQRQLMKSSWQLGDSWATALWKISWELHLCLCFFCFTFFCISVFEKNNVPFVVCCWSFSNGFLNLKVKIFQNNNSKSPWETNGPNFKEPLQ